MITDQKLLVAIFKIHILGLSHRLQGIQLHIHDYNINILYKPRPQLFIADRLFRHNHKMKKDEGILGMGISTNVIETFTGIPDCMPAEEIWLATLEDEHIDVLSNYILPGWPSTKAEV